MPHIPTTTKLLLVTLAVLASGYYLLIERLCARVERQYAEAAEEPMVDTARLLAAMLEGQITTAGLDGKPLETAFAAVGSRPFEAVIYDLKKNEVTTSVYLTDANGTVLFDSAEPANVGRDFSAQRDVSLTLRGEYGARSTRWNAQDSTSSTMYVGAPVMQAGKPVGVLTVGKSKQSHALFREETQRHIRRIGWTIFVSTAAATVLVAAWFLRPIRRLTAHVLSIEKGERPKPFTSRSPEVRNLGRTFEKMRDALEGRAYVEQYIQSLTHEMKSPVAAIRGAAELLESPAMPTEQRARFLANIQGETQRLQSSIDRLLALAAIESQKELANPRDLDVAALTRLVCRELEPAMAARQLNPTVDCKGTPHVFGDEFLLESALSNLLQNAIDFSPPGGTIAIAIAPDGERHCRVSIADDGPGIPDYARSRVFERFYSLPRPATGRKSSGLGLCFVREAAELHGGSVALADRSSGTGTVATLRLPLA